MLNLKYNSDVRTLVFEAIYFALLYVQWFHGTEFHILFRVFLWLMTCHFSFLGAVATHNCVHVPMFKNATLNSWFQVILTLTMGHPVSTLVPGHNLSHHKYLQSRKDVMRTYNFQHKWHLLNLLLFTVSIQGRMQRNDWKYFMAQREKGRPIWDQVKLEFFCHVLAQAIYIVADWKKWLLIIVIPQLYSKICISTLNMLQHDGCDETSEYNHSRNFVGQSLNFWAYNNGYHTIHHMYPGKHWSLLPAAHEKLVKPLIHKNLDVDSILYHIWSTFVYPGKRLRYDGTSFIWPSDSSLPPIDWAFHRDDVNDKDKKEDVYLARKSIRVKTGAKNAQ